MAEINEDLCHSPFLLEMAVFEVGDLKSFNMTVRNIFERGGL